MWSKMRKAAALCLAAWSCVALAADAAPGKANMAFTKGSGLQVGVMITDDEDWLDEWKKPTPNLSVPGSIPKGKLYHVVVLVRNPAIGKDGKAKLMCKLKGLRPDGSVEIESKSEPCFERPSPIHPMAMMLSSLAIKGMGDPGDQLGKWSFVVEVKDVASGEVVAGSSSFELTPALPSGSKPAKRERSPATPMSDFTRGNGLRMGMLITDQSEKELEASMGKPGGSIRTPDYISKGKPFFVMVMINNPKVSKEGYANLACSSKVFAPNGKVAMEVPVKLCFRRKGPFDLKMAMLMIPPVDGLVEKKDPSGLWRFEFTVKDLVSGETIKNEVSSVFGDK